MSPHTERVDLIARVLAKAAREGVDVADLLAASCRRAAARLDGVRLPGYDLPLAGDDALVAGRSGSWEAEHLRALAGGWEYERKAAAR